MKIRVEVGFKNCKEIKEHLKTSVSIIETDNGITMKLNTYDGGVMNIEEGDILSNIYGPWIIERRI